MIEKIEPWIRGKRILLLGFGREGQSTYRVLKKLNTYSRLDIADQAARQWLPDPDVDWITGPDYQKCLNSYDVVFKSPGIVLEEPFDSYQCQIVSQTELFFHCFRDQIIGITGTKGKSTITSLLYHVLKTAGTDCMVAGNIGIPAFDHMEEIRKDTIIVFELSCHQLEYMTISPHMGVLVNIHEEHLDHYKTMENYIRAKRRIYINQKADDVLVCNTQCLPQEGTCPSRLIAVGDESRGAQATVTQEDGESYICYDGSRFRIETDKIRLKGRHNYFDIAVTYVICRLLGIGQEFFGKGLESYQPLPHRLQYLGEKDKIKYYDDSISTICETTIQALETLTDADTVLIGGMDRGIDYRELIEFLSAHPIPHIILMEATGKRIYEEIKANYPDFRQSHRLVLTSHMEEAVKEARKLTSPGRSCVLSPAAASYGIYKNFEDRGQAFASLVFR